jgi:hypothetical protein
VQHIKIAASSIPIITRERTLGFRQCALSITHHADINASQTTAPTISEALLVSESKNHVTASTSEIEDLFVGAVSVKRTKRIALVVT